MCAASFAALGGCQSRRGWRCCRRRQQIWCPSLRQRTMENKVALGDVSTSRAFLPPAPSSTERRHRGGSTTVCVAPGDGLRWASISKLLVMLVSSMGRRFGSFKADPARTTCSGRLVRFVISSFWRKGG
ncbi:hypothetical protein PVAP13_8NG248300 [Panicum virgatum]|uniref:Uncharacterized protein n=1 Tax=Panicum virgatum TaxID=38727 RepID=A0A8T0PDI0_PANVG|nr:hypothetical protein PVAP13_8NG248300 [Panicum virgatum]